MAKTIDEFLSTIAKNPTHKISHTRNGYDYLREYGEYIKQSIKNGTSPFLPDENGEINLQPAYDLYNKRIALGYPLFKKDVNLTPEQKKKRFQFEIENDALKQVLFLTKQKELNAPTPAFITYDAIQDAIASGVKCSVPKGTHGISIPFFDPVDWGKINTISYINENGERVEKKRDVWFNLSQIEGSDELAMYCKNRIAERVSFDFANKPMYIEKENTIELSNHTSSCDIYLMQVLASMENGDVIRVSPEQAKSFQKDMISQLSAFNKKINKPDEVAIKRICNNAAKLLSKFRLEKKLDKYRETEKPSQKKIVVKRKRTVYPYSKER